VSPTTHSTEKARFRLSRSGLLSFPEPRDLTEKKPDPTLEHRVNRLASDLVEAQRKIHRMEMHGGFTDAKTHSMRAARIENRVDVVETKIDALLDVAAAHVALLEDHLQDRHDADLARDDTFDIINFRKIRKRLHVLAERLGLNKRRDLTEARRSESRLRRQQAANP